MSILQRLGKSSAIKMVYFNYIAHCVQTDKVQTWPTGSFYLSLINPRFYAHRSCVCPTERYGSSSDNDENIVKISSTVRRLAQAALFEYLYYTGSLQFTDAEHISKNSPTFLENLIAKVDNGVDIERKIARFLRYNPINEFEPFFESTGLKPPEYSLMLPRNSIILGDDEQLLGNYHVLCNYGVERNKIGMIFKGSPEVLKYKSGVLLAKIKAYETLGLSRTFISKLIISSPSLLTGDLNRDFIEVLEKLNNIGLELTWLEENCSDKITSYRWSQILRLLSLLSRVGCSNKQLNRFIRQHSEVIFENSGQMTFSLIGFLFKFGSTIDELYPMFLHFPETHVAKFVSNLRQGFLLLTDIDMDPEDIGRVMRCHSLLLGQCDLKKSNSVLAQLNIGKRRLGKIIIENPQSMKNWVRGKKINRLPPDSDGHMSYLEKIKFLSGLGFVDNSIEMKNALKVYRGKGDKLQERFDCLVRAGLDPEDVAEMVRVSPQILNQSKDVILMKVDYLVTVLGYSVSTLVRFPSYLNYQIKRVKLRCMMYNWLVDRGAADAHLSLPSIVSTTEKMFITRHVKHHRDGLKIFQEMKRGIYDLE